MLQATILSSNPNATKIDIQSNTSKLLFNVRYQSPAIGTLATSPYKAVGIMYYNLWQIIKDTRITITRYSKRFGTVIIASNMLLTHLMEAAQCNAGRVKIMPVDFNDDAEQDFIASFSVELCNSGSMSLGLGDYLSVEVSGMANYTLGALANQVWQIGLHSYGSFNLVDNEVLEYRGVLCQGSQDVDINVDGAYAICIPKTIIKGTFTSNMPNPDYLEVTSAEMAAISADRDEAIAEFGGATVTDFHFNVIPTAACKSVRVQFPATVHCYMLVNKVLQPIGS